MDKGDRWVATGSSPRAHFGGTMTLEANSLGTGAASCHYDYIPRWSDSANSAETSHLALSNTWRHPEWCVPCRVATKECPKKDSDPKLEVRGAFKSTAIYTIYLPIITIYAWLVLNTSGAYITRIYIWNHHNPFWGFSHGSTYGWCLQRPEGLQQVSKRLVIIFPFVI